MSHTKPLRSASNIWAFAAFVFVVGCSNTIDQSTAPQPPPAPEEPKPPVWHDLGTIPAAFGSSLLIVGQSILAGTTDGVWRRPLDTDGNWERSGLDGVNVRVLRTVPNQPNTILAGGNPGLQPELLLFYISSDGGHSWVGHGDGLFASFEQQYVPMADLAVQPLGAGSSTPVLYANMSGASLARSRDLGTTWEYVAGSAAIYLQSDCRINIVSSAPNTLYQGCEAPLDQAWVGTYDITDPDAESIGSPVKVVPSDEATGIGNRRPNGLVSTPADPSTLYVGLEGGLVAVQGNDWHWLWKADPSAATALGAHYTYVRTIWVDPNNLQHLVFGGGDSTADVQRAGLYETKDRGATVFTPSNAPTGIDFSSAIVAAGVAAPPENKRFVILVQESDSLHVLIRDADTR